jgi:hypothetical protein
LKRHIGQHAIKGATKEKSRKLDELKARRRAKDEKKRASVLISSHIPSLIILSIDKGQLPKARSVIVTYGHGNIFRRGRGWSDFQI